MTVWVWLVAAIIQVLLAQSKVLQPDSSATCTLTIEFRDTIGPATYDYLMQAQQEAMKSKCSSVLVLINTPGGSLQSTRKIVEAIVASPIPFLCLVHPAGGHAGSAGAIIMQACHVNGMMEATNIGAASPIMGSGQEMSEDLRKKLFEDTRSWVEGLAQYRGRSEKFATDIVLEAKALDARKALQAKAIDIVVTDPQDFLDFSQGRTVRGTGDADLSVEVGESLLYPPGLRHDLMQILSNPQWAYLLFMGSLGLLYFELTHPGMILPGVVGAIGTVISLMNFHMLDVSWGGVLLIALGMGLLFAELFVPSFGALGFGGLVSFVLGSLLLFEEGSGYSIPTPLILATSLILAALMFTLSYLALSAKRRGERNRERELLKGKSIVVRTFDLTKKEGLGFVRGEIWKICSTDSLQKGDHGIITDVDGLNLTVKKK